VHFHDVAEHPVHAPRFLRQNASAVGVAADDVRSQDHEQLGLLHDVSAVTEHPAELRQVTEPGNLVLGHGIVLGDQATDRHGLAVVGYHGGVHCLHVENRGADAVAQGHPGAWHHRRDLWGHAHDDFAVWADLRRDVELHTDIAVADAGGGEAGGCRRSAGG